MFDISKSPDAVMKSHDRLWKGKQKWISYAFMLEPSNYCTSLCKMR